MNQNTMNNRTNYQGTHILAKGHIADTDIWTTGLNNNVLIFGPAGSGKTRHYVKPNLLRSHESMVISDTKGSLYEEVGPILAAKGYIVKNIDFTDLTAGSGYNPMDYIRYDAGTDRFSEQDILSLSHCLVENWSGKDPYWDYAARQYLSCLISYVLEALPEEEHTLESVIRLFNQMDDACFPLLMDELNDLKPGSTTALRYNAFKCIAVAEKMNASIRGILSTNLDPLCFDDALALYRKPDKIDFTILGKEKCAVFLTISDTDRSMDKLANAFMTQALQVLCRSADHDHPHHRLTVPVRFYFDDFATNLYIPDFDKIISVIRSREISVSVILQSITQLYSLYGNDRGKTILNNCDRMLYLGGNDPSTAEYLSARTNRPVHTILSMPIQNAWLFIRGEKPVLTEKYDITEDEKALAMFADEGPEPVCA